MNAPAIAQRPDGTYYQCETPATRHGGPYVYATGSPLAFHNEDILNRLVAEGLAFVGFLLQTESLVCAIFVDPEKLKASLANVSNGRIVVPR